MANKMNLARGRVLSRVGNLLKLLTVSSDPQERAAARVLLKKLKKL